ncbi:GNAT family N-acetyltransferase [Cellulomonas fimi]|uniref:GNAT family N-acetyltransferase n=1 Tax=Cellulomonas fimi TaxID=1708 RepID=UPI0002E290BF|nr:GNAT family N-acetyltransferase [Cellulomonas fimi]NNH06553.1 GNAT family N-acetyltransferase [Cellulomonas fimi]
MRPGVQVRTACPDDLEDLVDVCLAARREAAVGAQLCTDDADRLREQLGALRAFPGGLVLAGAVDGRTCGLLLARVLGPGPFTDVASMSIEAVYVLPEVRRRGLGHALLAGAVARAEEVGATELYASPLPGARGMQRFLARMGFAPAATHRVVTTSALQRRLAHDAAPAVLPGTARRSGSRGLEDLIARRRQGRIRAEGVAVTGGVPVVVRQTDAAGQPRASISMQVNRAVQSRRPSASSTTTS